MNDTMSIEKAICQLRHNFLVLGLLPPAEVVLASRDDGTKVLSGLNPAMSYLDVERMLRQSEVVITGVKITWPR